MAIVIKKFKPRNEASTDTARSASTATHPAVATKPIDTRSSIQTRPPGPDKTKKKQGHAKVLPLTLSLSQPGRLRVGHLMNLLSISHATLYARLLTGSLPKPDGKDGKRPYWRTATVRALLEK